MRNVTVKFMDFSRVLSNESIESFHNCLKEFAGASNFKIDAQLNNGVIMIHSVSFNITKGCYDIGSLVEIARDIGCSMIINYVNDHQ